MRFHEKERKKCYRELAVEDVDEKRWDPKGPALNIRILSCFPQENSIKSRENSFKKSEIRHFMEEEDRNTGMREG